MAEVKDYGNVVRYSPPPVEKLWIYRLTPATDEDLPF